MTDLPPGVHPSDKSSIVTGPDWGHSFPVQQDHPAPRPGNTSRRPFATENQSALGVYERSSEQWSVGLVIITATNGGTALARGRLVGRKSITLSVPTALPGGQTPVGVLFGPTQDSVQDIYAAGILNVGDSVTINTEAAVYVGLQNGQTFGCCQVLVESNPPQGSFIQ